MMNVFDRLCARIAFVPGVIVLLLGVFGLFAGRRAQFSLPPVLGILPALVGWGILRFIVIAWKVPPSSPFRDAEV